MMVGGRKWRKSSPHSSLLSRSGKDSQPRPADHALPAASCHWPPPTPLRQASPAALAARSCIKEPLPSIRTPSKRGLTGSHTPRAALAIARAGAALGTGRRPALPRFVLSGVLFCPAAGKLARLLPPGAAGLSRAHGVGHIGENDTERRSFSAFLTSIDPSLRHMYSYSTIDSRTRDRTPPRWLAHQTTPRIPAAPPSLHNKYLQSSVLHSTASDLDRAPHANKQTSKGQARRPSKPIPKTSFASPRKSTEL